ncbi:MAG: HAD hydrolase family protein [bacterium]|nr:HAD hydrolase family protein [bacterium]
MRDNASLLNIKLLVLDFDGIMTNGKVRVDQNGIESVECSRKDGLGIDLLKKYGISVCVISKETNPVVSKRCAKLKIPCVQAIENSDGKLEILSRIMKEMSLKPDEVAFMGDDLNDIDALKNAGVSFTVSDGHPEVKKICNYITRAGGGQHAVREVAELILKAKGIRLNKF